MHNTYFFYRQLAPELSRKLAGYELAEIFTQDQNELVIGLHNGKEEFWIKVLFWPGLTHLVFPEQFFRKKKNVLTIFPDLIGERIQSVECASWDRALRFTLESGRSVQFLMYGQFGNVVTVEYEVVQAGFFSIEKGVSLPKAWEVEQDLQPETWLTTFTTTQELKSEYPQFGSGFFQWLNQIEWESWENDRKVDFLKTLGNEVWDGLFNTFQLVGKKQVLLLFRWAQAEERTNSYIDLANLVFRRYIKKDLLANERSILLADLKSEIKRLEKYITNQKKKLDKLENEVNYRLWADLLMANLHAIPENVRSIDLPGFEDPNQLVTIPLKEHTKPQDLAAQYYRKSKNQQEQIRHMRETIDSKELELLTKEEVLEELATIDDLRTIRQLQAEHGKNKGQVSTQQEARLPYKHFEKDGFEIRVGKSAKDNDELLRSYSSKFDIWLHAKDVAGSHVVIASGKDKTPGPEVVEYAAQLAAYYSKRRSDSICPVIVTPRKYVRKSKGAPAGQVIVDREDVIFANPNQLNHAK